MNSVTGKPLTKKQIRDTINSVAWGIKRAVERDKAWGWGKCGGWGSSFDVLVALCLADEKGHRKFTGSRYRLPASVAADYFAARELLDGAQRQDGDFSADHVLTVRESCLKGAALGWLMRDTINA